MVLSAAPFVLAVWMAARSVHCWPGLPMSGKTSHTPSFGVGSAASARGRVMVPMPDPTSRTKAPGDVVLLHELSHAKNNAHGTQDNTSRTDNFPDNEEFNAVQDENAYRHERGVPRRIDYNDS